MKEDGSDEALGAYDNICSYLTIAGKVTEQTKDFWAPLADYCLRMENDEVEVEHVIEFFVEQLKVNKEVIAVKEKIVNLLVQLFFGRFYSFMKNDKEFEQQVVDLKVYLQSIPKKQLQDMARRGSDFVKINFANFWQ